MGCFVLDRSYTRKQTPWQKPLEGWRQKSLGPEVNRHWEQLSESNIIDSSYDGGFQQRFLGPCDHRCARWLEGFPGCRNTRTNFLVLFRDRKMCFLINSFSAKLSRVDSLDHNWNPCIVLPGYWSPRHCHLILVEDFHSPVLFHFPRS